MAGEVRRDWPEPPAVLELEPHAEIKAFQDRPAAQGFPSARRYLSLSRKRYNQTSIKRRSASLCAKLVELGGRSLRALRRCAAFSAAARTFAAGPPLKAAAAAVGRGFRVGPRAASRAAKNWETLHLSGPDMQPRLR